MRIPRIYLDGALTPGATLRLPPAQGHRAARVLRLGAGCRIVLFNGDGWDYAAEISALAKTGVVVRIDARLPGLAPSPLVITLVQGLSRGERMDYTLQKATELGVAAFQPVDTARSEVHLKAGRLEHRLAHWRSVIVSACEQCGRADVPELRAPLDLPDWLSQPSPGARLVLDPGAERSLAAVAAVAGASAVELLAGPEGGLEDAELTLLARHGVERVRLGPRVLRTETAGAAAIAVLQAIAGDYA